MIIGLTGKNGAGKGVGADFLKELGYQYYSLSDVIREEMTKKKIAITRENLIKFANEMRTTYGPSILAEKILAKLDPDKNYVVDSVRNPFEVETLRKRKDFHLIVIEADPKARFERIKARAREKDPITYEDFLKIAQNAKECYVKIVITEDTQQRELDHAIQLIHSVDEEIPVILQPASFTRFFKKVPTMEQVDFFADQAKQRLKTVRVIPQMHKILGVQ